MIVVHILAVVSTVMIILSAEHYAFNWIRGKVFILDEKKLNQYHKYTSAGFVAILATGGFMFMSDYKYLLTSNAFLLKIAFVGTLLINSVSIGYFMQTTTKSKFTDLSPKEKIPLFIAGGISTVCWVGAVTCAFFIY